MRILARLSLPLALVLVAVGCTPGEEAVDRPTPPVETTPPPPETPAPEPPPVDDPEGAAEVDDDTADAGPRPVGEFDTADVATDDFPTGGGEVAQLVDVRVGAHEGFDRIVLEFDGPDAPSYRVAYVDPPVVQDGSGRELDVAGAAFLELRLAPASGVDIAGEEPDHTYEGPDRLRPAHAQVIAELVRNGDFEADLAWTAGLEREAAFAVTVLRSPLRLVVDITH